MDADDDDEALERLYSRSGDFVRQQPMVPRDRKIRTNPSREDLSRRRRNRRTAVGGEMTSRADLMRAVAQAKTLSEQQRLLDQVRALDESGRRTASLDRELDFAADVVAHTLAPVRTHVFHTAATDWLAGDVEVPADFQHRAAAEAAAWFGRTSAAVRRDGEEFQIQAEGKARQIAGQYGLQAQAAAQVFMDYATFLRAQAASGLDQIQQTTAPDGVTERPTPMPEDVFDNFAPPVHPINEGVSGSESSDRAPLIQEIMGGGSGMDGGAPEKPGGHSTNDELSWAPPEGMQADTAPGWGDGDPGTPEKGGDRPEYPGSTTAARYASRSMAIGGYAYTMDDFRREAAARPGRGNDLGGRKVAASGCCADCKGCKGGGCCKGCKDCKSCSGKKEAASGLDQIDQTVAPDGVTVRPTDYPGEVAFPLNEEFQGQPTTGGTGQVQGSKTASHKCSQCGGSVSKGKCGKCGAKCSCAECKAEKGKTSRRVQADMYGNSDDPHAVKGGPVANSPATTPEAPYGSQSAGQAAGKADAQSGGAATFADGSSSVPGYAQGVGEGYATQIELNTLDQPTDMPGSMVGAPNATTHAGSRTAAGLPEGWKVTGQDVPSHMLNAGDHILHNTHGVLKVNRVTQVNAKTPGQGRQNLLTEAEFQHPESGQTMTYQGHPFTAVVVAPKRSLKDRLFGQGKVSSLIVTAMEREDPDFCKGYGYGSNWKPGVPLVSLGSASFEAGVYAGISDNAKHQRAFMRAHRDSSYEVLTVRAKKHTTLTHRIAAKNDQPTNGLYLTAATSIELNTTAPNTTPAADGSTPINGRGNPGPLDGLQDAAAPAGAAPYNGAPPYGSPVVPGGNQAEPNPADALTGGGGMSTPAQVSAFRKTVQANLLRMRQGK